MLDPLPENFTHNMDLTTSDIETETTEQMKLSRDQLQLYRSCGSSHSIGVSIKSLQELDETIAAVIDLGASSVHENNEENHSPVNNSSVFSVLDNHPMYSQSTLIANMNDLRVKPSNRKPKDHDSRSRISRTGSREGRSTRSRTSTTSGSKSRSSRRKESAFERIIRNTVLDIVTSTGEVTCFSERDDLSGHCSNYSTEDILNDLIRSDAGLAISSKSQRTPRLSCKSSEQKSESSQTKVEEPLINGLHTNLLPPLISNMLDDAGDDDGVDDATWLHDRLAEPFWGGGLIDVCPNTTEHKKCRQLQRTNVSNSRRTLSYEGHSFDEWGFEVVDFPTGSTDPASVKSSCPGPKQLDGFWTNFDRNPFHMENNSNNNGRDNCDDVSHRSPSSVADFCEPVADSKSTPRKKSGSIEAAWKRRLRRSRVVDAV